MSCACVQFHSALKIFINILSSFNVYEAVFSYPFTRLYFNLIFHTVSITLQQAKKWNLIGADFHSLFKCTISYYGISMTDWDVSVLSATARKHLVFTSSHYFMNYRVGETKWSLHPFKQFLRIKTHAKICGNKRLKKKSVKQSS